MRTEQHPLRRNRLGQFGDAPDAFFSGDVEPDLPSGRQFRQFAAADRRQCVKQHEPQVGSRLDQACQRLRIGVRNLHERMLNADVVHPHG